MNKENKKRESGTGANRNAKRKTLRSVFTSYGRKTRVIFILLCVILLALVLWGVISAVCMSLPVKRFSISGGVIYTNDEIINASGITGEDKLQSVDTDEAGTRILKKLPYIKEAEIKRSFPATIEIMLVPDEALYYVEVGGEFFALSKELRVLERSVVYAPFVERGLICLALPRIESAVIGYGLAFSDRETDFSHITEYLDSLIHTVGAGRINGVDIISKFNIKVVFDEKYLVKMGDMTDTDIKIRVLMNIFGDKEFDKEIKSTLDVSDPKKVSVKPDYTGTLDLVLKSEGE